jgi:hypothetical protein
VWAKDADIGNNGFIDYTIISGNVDTVFEIHPSYTGIVRTRLDASRLDREIRSSYHLVIQAEDRGFPSQRTTCQLLVTVVDVNDNPPNFPAGGPGPVSVPESKCAFTFSFVK